MNHKLFFIGFNRTGTKSYCDFFTRCGIESIHSHDWWHWTSKEDFSVAQVYTDGFEERDGNVSYPNLDLLLEFFPDAKFILNTRNLDKWLASRLNHATVIRSDPKTYSGFPITPMITGDKEWLPEPEDPTKTYEYHQRLLEWTFRRNFWHEKVKKYYSDSKLDDSNFLIINISTGEFNMRNRPAAFTSVMKDFLGVDFVPPPNPRLHHLNFNSYEIGDRQRVLVNDFLNKYIQEDSFEELVVKLK